MAAEAASAAGCTVSVYEGKRSVGRKFLVAGKGGLNLTHSEPLAGFLARYREATPRLAPFLDAFPPAALRAFADALGQETWIGSSGRVFPRDAKAAPLLRAWVARLRRAGVRFHTRHRFLGFTTDSADLPDSGPPTPPMRAHARISEPTGEMRAHARISGVRLRDEGSGREVVVSGACVLALGGGSWPETGSDGAWVEALRAAGIAVRDLAPSNAGWRVAWPAGFAERAEAKPLKNVELAVGDERARGDVIVSRYGIEGTPVYRLTPLVRAALARGPVTVHLDLKPDLGSASLAKKLGAAKKSLSTRLKAARLDETARALAAAAARDAGGSLAERLKAMPLEVTALQPIAEAISSAGGVQWDALDEHLMLVRAPGTFVAGEMIDWEAPTGGYLLQACFSTGHAAGRAAAAWARLRE